MLDQTFLVALSVLFFMGTSNVTRVISGAVEFIVVVFIAWCIWNAWSDQDGDAILFSINGRYSRNPLDWWFASVRALGNEGFNWDRFSETCLAPWKYASRVIKGRKSVDDKAPSVTRASVEELPTHLMQMGSNEL
jgi:hypothetical protein